MQDAAFFRGTFDETMGLLVEARTRGRFGISSAVTAATGHRIDSGDALVGSGGGVGGLMHQTTAS